MQYSSNGGFSPSGEGREIIDIDSGYCVAELINEKILYIHHAAIYADNEAERQIFRRLLQEVVAELSLSPAEKKVREKQITEAMKNRSREAFVKACSQRFDKMLSGTKKTIDDGFATIKRLQDELVIKVREVKGSEQKLVQLEKARPAAEDGYRKEFEKFLTITDIKRVEAGDGLIKVFTNMIYITHNSVKYRIGEFRIDIYLNGGIKFFNLTNEGKGPSHTRPEGFNGNASYNYHHPHVMSDGTPCLGNISTALPQLIGEYQYSVVAILAIQFLKSVNADDGAGQGIYWWPKAEEAIVSPETVGAVASTQEEPEDLRW